jgi:hypothetical protein
MPPPSVNAEQDQLDRRLRVIRVVTGVALAALAVLAGLLLSGARAADLPCPPKHTACWQVRLAVDTIGEVAAVAQARALNRGHSVMHGLVRASTSLPRGKTWMAVTYAKTRFAL